jgi:hypothetical protein
VPEQGQLASSRPAPQAGASTPDATTHSSGSILAPGTPAAAVAGAAAPAVPDAPAWRLPTPAARTALAAARGRGVPEPDRIVFIGLCPACGADATWREERDDTRLRVAVDCPCE